MTEKWIKDTGLVLVLFFVFLGFNGNKEFLFVSIILLVAAIFVPKILYPIAYVWKKLVVLLGFIVPKIFFSLVFFIIIFPIGFIRKLIKGDMLIISGWREVKTAFINRDHCFSKRDLEVPY